MLFTRLTYNYIRMQHSLANIKLNQTENDLFNTLTQYKQELGLHTVMRVAGGWVRDKVDINTYRSWAKNRMISISH